MGGLGMKEGLENQFLLGVEEGVLLVLVFFPPSLSLSSHRLVLSCLLPLVLSCLVVSSSYGKRKTRRPFKFCTRLNGLPLLSSSYGRIGDLVFDKRPSLPSSSPLRLVPPLRLPLKKLIQFPRPLSSPPQILPVCRL